MARLETNKPLEFKKIGGSYFIPVPKQVLEFHGFDLEKPVDLVLVQSEENGSKKQMRPAGIEPASVAKCSGRDANFPILFSKQGGLVEGRILTPLGEIYIKEVKRQ